MYNREIEGLIEHGQRLDEAIAHCRHILKSYPKYLETYRLLGKANLEAKRYNEAVDIFQRVLVAAPDDFVSHVGMSIIADDQNKLDEAIWHMERAFEVQPSNAAIQGELQRLFGRRDGVEPPKIRLTRAALAHMYVQGELYNQAISEIRAVLGNDPKRTDMQVLLAKAYFRNGQKAEATDICNELLKGYPYCLDADRLMVEILPGTQHADTIQQYRNRVNELDPYAAFTQDSLFHTETVADNAISLERLEYTGQAVDASGALGIGLESDSTAAGRGSNQPKWLNPASSMDAGGPFNSQSAPGSESQNATAGTGSQNDIPDFLRQAGWSDSTGDFQEGTASFANDDDSAAVAASGAVQGDLPDWVKALAPAEENEPAGQSSSSSEASPLYSSDTPDWLRNLGGDQPAAPVSATISEELPKEETPDWLKNLGEQELDAHLPPLNQTQETEGQGQSADWLNSLRNDQPVNPQVDAPREESPDWLKEFDNDLETPIAKTNQTAQPSPFEPKSTGADFGLQSPPVQDAGQSGNLGSLGTTAQEQDDAMAWLESLASKHGAKPEELVTDPNSRTDIAPDWVDKAKEIGEQVPASEMPVIPAPDDLTGSWLRNLEANEDQDDLPKQGLQETPDWMSGLNDQNAPASVIPESPKEKVPIFEYVETPDWLSDLGPKPVQQSSMEDVPDWLHEPSAKAAPTDSIPSQASSSISGPSVDLPDWLAGLDKEEAAVPSPMTSSDEVPAWLKSEVEPEPQFTEKAQPADWKPVEVKRVIEEPQELEPAVVAERSLPTEEPVKKTEQRISEQPRPTSVKVAQPKPAPLPSKNVQNPIPSSLGNAQSELGRGNIAASLDIYSKLIRKGKSLEDIIRDLRDALYRYPVEVPIWQALGDAYMRANRLQEALDAYTKAEELLR
jgi:tetratricopeptide (TPR) repeat protein